MSNEALGLCHVFNRSNIPLKRHLFPARLLISVSSVTPAVEKEVDSSILPREGEELSGCSVSPSAADSRKNSVTP